MRRTLLISTLCGTFLAGGAGLVGAQVPAAPKPQAAPAAKQAARPPAAPGETGDGRQMMLCDHERGGGMGMGPMGMGSMGMGPMGMGPMMMGGAATKVAVKNVDKGVTITLTSADPGTAARLQKMAEGMRLMHEAMAPDK
jgi:hypothetical protein